jgi:hypothetical protein
MRAMLNLPRRGHWVAIVGVTAIAAFVSACSVVDSTRISVDPPALGYATTTCSSALGSYALPKAFLQIQIGQSDQATPPDINVATGAKAVKEVRHPDPALIFCLDHLNSPTSDDAVKVIKWSPPGTTTGPKQPFLGAVTFNITDQSAYIIEALVRAAFIAGSGNAQFQARSATFDPSKIIADIEYDPFDQRESADVNARLQKLGFCLVLEIYTFDPRVGVQRYCNSPLTYAARPSMYAKAYRKAQEEPSNPHLPGLLYRPRYPYRLYIYHKTDPHGGEPWQLQQMITVNLENISPVLSLGVTRALFAGKNMNFVFQEGTLKTACISKDSEVEGFVQIPLQDSKSLVALPGQIFTIRIGDVTNQNNLVKAEQQLYLAQQAYLLNMMGQKTPIPAGGPTTAQSYPALPDPSNFTIPTDIVKQQPAQDYGTDLLSNNLKNICQGTS